MLGGCEKVMKSQRDVIAKSTADNLSGLSERIPSEKTLDILDILDIIYLIYKLKMKEIMSPDKIEEQIKRAEAIIKTKQVFIRKAKKDLRFAELELKEKELEELKKNQTI